MEPNSDRFHYIFSSDLKTNVFIKIGTLDGSKERQQYEKLLEDPMLKFSGLHQQDKADLMVVCQVFSDGEPLAPPVSTSYKPFTVRWSWNEWVRLPVLYSDLPRDAQLALTIYDCVGAGKTRPIGGTTISLFGKHGVMREGMFDLKVWPDKEADPNFPSQTPGKTKNEGKEQMQRLAKLAKKHRNGQLPKVDWSDRLAFREIEHINESEKKNSKLMHLMVEFSPIVVNDVQHSVVYYEHDGDEIYPSKRHGDVVTIPDHEILQENLVENKHRKLARSIRSGVSSRDLKPNADTRDMLKKIVGYPPTTQLSGEEQDTVWQFRFYLSSQKKALTKFLKCVKWSTEEESQQAIELIQKWEAMDVEDALELLSRNFTHPTVRQYAVTRLQQAPDEDLLLYLLQLVQALRYEDPKCVAEAASRYPIDGDDDDDNEDHNHSSITSKIEKAISDSSVSDRNSETGDDSQVGSDDLNTNPAACDLATFLVNRAARNTTLANYFHWYLKIECEERATNGQEGEKAREMYETVMRLFSATLKRVQPDSRKFLKRQRYFIGRLVNLIKTVSRESGSRKKKMERLQQLLAEPDDPKFNFTSFKPLIFPLDPTISIKGIIPEKTFLYGSALMPARLTFVTTDDTEYVAIFKYGDDLRQDQLILQIITLMDKLLRSENLDLRLTPYRVLATSSKHGFLQFIESTTVADVHETEGTILSYLRKHNPSETGPYGVSSHVIDTYIRSVAGYCVITYLLGVGDRHFDNLLLTKNGQLFHIDFGFILGRDPKPMPPPMKLSKDMVDAMGGDGSEHYQQFRKLCYTAFLHLRRHANLILNLFSLMVNSSVPDIALEPDKTVKKVQDKLQLGLTDEEAVQHMQNQVDLSLSAVMPALVEQIHKIARNWRK